MARRKSDIQNQVTFSLSGEYERFEKLVLMDTEQSNQEAFLMIKNKMNLRNSKWVKTAQEL